METVAATCPYPGLVEVTTEEFFKIVYAHKLNVHPSPEPNVTYWRFLRDQSLFAWSSRGYVGNYPGFDGERYFVPSSYVKQTA